MQICGKLQRQQSIDVDTVCALVQTCECHLASLRRTYSPTILLLNWQQQKNNKDDDDRWMREAARRRQKNNNMGKSAFKRFKSILETINIVYLSQQLLHNPSPALCVGVRQLLSYLLYLERISHQLFLTFFHKTHWCMNKRLATRSLTRYYDLTTVYDVSIDKLHVWWARALQTWTSVQFFCCSLLPGMVFFFFFVSCMQEQQQTIDSRCRAHRRRCQMYNASALLPFKNINGIRNNIILH